MLDSISAILKDKNASDGAKLAGCLFLLVMLVVLFTLNTVAFKYNLWLGTSKDIGWLGAAGISALMTLINKQSRVMEINMVVAGVVSILAVNGIVTTPFWTI